MRIRLQVDPLRYNGAWSCAAATARNEGLRAFFRGAVPPMIGLGFQVRAGKHRVGPVGCGSHHSFFCTQNALLFGVYGPTLELIDAVHGKPDSGERESLTHVALAGCAGGSAQTLVCTPLELLKIRMQMNRGKPMPLLRTARSVVREHGIRRGLYRGFWTTVVRDCPSYGVWFWTYEYCKRYFVDELRWQGPLLPAASFLSGGTAGVASWASSYPIDVIKSRYQSAVGPTVAQCIRDCYAESGWRGFFHGFSTSMFRGFLCSGVTFVAVETGLWLTEKLNEWRLDQ